MACRLSFVSKKYHIHHHVIRYCTTSKSLYKTADILYLDKKYCIVNKPANICIDGKDEITMEKLTRATLDEMNHDYKSDHKQKIRHCHQLDKPTSGILIYGLTTNATKKMNKIIQNRNLTKIYYAIVNGHIPIDINHFILDFPISDETEVMIGNNKKEGRPAITECWLEKIGYFKQFPVSLLKIKLYTGRKHQIRLHLSQIGHSIVGDTKYSDNYKAFERMYLDSHQTIFNVNIENNKQCIDVKTKSNEEFDALIMNKDGWIKKDKYNDVHLVDHTKYNYSMIVPYVVCKERGNKDGDIRILIKKQAMFDNCKGPRLESISDGKCWSFVSECKLGQQYCDIAQNAAKHFLKQYTYFGKYLYQKSLFCPHEFEQTLYGIKNGGLDGNVRYITHHLASNLRRGNVNYLSVFREPYVIYFVRIGNGILKDKKHLNDQEEEKMQWVCLDELKTKSVCGRVAEVCLNNITDQNELQICRLNKFVNLDLNLS